MKKLTLRACVDNLQKVRAFVGSFLEPVNCSAEDRYQLCLVVDELFTNIASYAYGPEGGCATIQLEFDGVLRTVRVTMIDQGMPFNPLEREDPEIMESIDDRPIGGLGIFIMKQTMDSVSYDYADGQNIVSFSKRL